jgi:hypothetical protein
VKVALNDCYGGFGVSKALFDELGFKWTSRNIGDFECGYLRNEDFGIESDNYKAYRSDPRLIAAIEKIGVEKASGSLAKIRIAHIPDGVEFEFTEYDGIESIHEKHRSW